MARTRPCGGVSNSQTVAYETPIAAATWRTRERKNSRPTPAAVPSTTARSAFKSSGTAATAGASVDSDVPRFPRAVTPAEFGLGVISAIPRPDVGRTPFPKHDPADTSRVCYFVRSHTFVGSHFTNWILSRDGRSERNRLRRAPGSLLPLNAKW